MRSGDLRHLIVIQERTSTRSAIGGLTTTWADLYPTRAAIWPLKATELLDSMKLELSVTHRIRIRHLRTLNITADMRIKWHDPMTDTDKYFNIISLINVDKRNLILEMLCLEET